MWSLLARALMLLLLGTGVGVALNGVRADGFHPDKFQAAQSCATPGLDGAGAGDGSAASTVSVLPPAEAVRLCGDPRVLVADVRPAAAFAQGHVAQAIHLPCGSAGDVVSSAIARVAGKHTLIVYGDTTSEARPVAESLRKRLPRADLRIIVIDGGFPAWDRAGLACTSGPCPECNEHAEIRP